MDVHAPATELLERCNIERKKARVVCTKRAAVVAASLQPRATLPASKQSEPLSNASLERIIHEHMQKIISASNARTPLVLRPSAAFVLQHLRSDDAPADARGQRQALVNRVVRGKDGNGGADGRRGGSQEGARAGTFGAPSRSPRGALAASPVEQSGHGLIDDADEQRAVDALRNLHAHASSPSNAKPAAKAHAKQAAQQGPKEPAVIAKVMADVYARAEAARMSSKAAATEARNAAYESRRAAKAPRPVGRPPKGGRGGWQKKKQNTPPSSFPGATPVSAYQSLAGRQSGVDLSSLGNLLAGHGAAQPSAAWSTQLPALSQEPARTAVAPRPAIVPMPRTSLQELMSKVVNERRSAPPPAAPATGVPVHSAAHRVALGMHAHMPAPATGVVVSAPAAGVVVSAPHVHHQQSAAAQLQALQSRAVAPQALVPQSLPQQSLPQHIAAQLHGAVASGAGVSSQQQAAVLRGYLQQVQQEQVSRGGATEGGVPAQGGAGQAGGRGGSQDTARNGGEDDVDLFLM